MGQNILPHARVNSLQTIFGRILCIEAAAHSRGGATRLERVRHASGYLACVSCCRDGLPHCEAPGDEGMGEDRRKGGLSEEQGGGGLTTGLCTCQSRPAKDDRVVPLCVSALLLRGESSRAQL